MDDRFKMTRKEAIRIGDTCLDNYHPHISHEEGDQSEALSFLITHAEKCPSCDKLDAITNYLKVRISKLKKKKHKTVDDYSELGTLVMVNAQLIFGEDKK